MTEKDLIAKPMTVSGVVVTNAAIKVVINELANAPLRFIGMDLLGPLPDHGFHWKQEVMNRLLQRWRKLDLIVFKRGHWSLTTTAWARLQGAA